MRSTASRTIVGFSTLTRFVTSFWFNRSCMARAAGRAPGPQAGLHQPPLALPAPIIALDQVGGKDKNNGSRPISRVLCDPPGTAAIPLGARSPARSSHLPASSVEQTCRCGFSHNSLAYLVLLRMEVA